MSNRDYDESNTGTFRGDRNADAVNTGLGASDYRDNNNNNPSSTSTYGTSNLASDHHDNVGGGSAGSGFGSGTTGGYGSGVGDGYGSRQQSSDHTASGSTGGAGYGAVSAGYGETNPEGRRGDGGSINDGTSYGTRGLSVGDDSSRGGDYNRDNLSRGGDYNRDDDHNRSGGINTRDEQHGSSTTGGSFGLGSGSGSHNAKSSSGHHDSVFSKAAEFVDSKMGNKLNHDQEKGLGAKIGDFIKGHKDTSGTGSGTASGTGHGTTGHGNNY